MKKRDIIIIVAVLAVAFAMFMAFNLFQTRESAVEDFVYIYVNDALYEADPLSEDKLIEIDQGNGMVNHVQIKDGKVYMSDSTCENQDCVEQGTMTGENVDTRPMRNWIVCLPNGISIELRLASEETT